MATVDLSKLITADMKAAQARAAQVAAIEAERNRRLSIGFEYNFGDARGVHRIATTDQDMRGWSEVSMRANASIALGDQSAMTTITTETGQVDVTAIEWQHILIAAGDYRQPIWNASFALQAMDPIPADIVDNQYWP